MYHILFIHSSVDGIEVDSISWLLYIVLQSMGSQRVGHD